MNISISKKPFVRINTWDDIYKMSGYTDSLDPKKEKLKRVIDKYTLPTTGKCGLSNCGTAHNNGYIVETDTGKLTNVGHICGKNHFGVIFQTLEKSFNREYRDRQAKEKIASFKSNSSQYLEKVVVIENMYGKIGHIHKLQQFFTHASRGCPSFILEMIKLMVKNRNPTIYKTIKLSKEEYETLKTSGVKAPSRYKEIPIGTIDGLAFLYHENNLRMYAEDFKNPLDELLNLNVSSLSSSQLDRWSKRVGEFDRTINQTHEIMIDSKIFLDRRNILKFRKLIPDDDTQFIYLVKILKDQFDIKI
ncbi:hypothetical protein [uncultured Psychrobacter sp.]|uniref:hypothetical protein n=1 Tax=uncultured Psychrobacter sp. TaxID=259303 RepID=UPI002639F613|nr:hypothetical protein [uncultured Psychrobacter sp.]